MIRRETKPLLLNDLNIYMPMERTSRGPSRGCLFFIALAIAAIIIGSMWGLSHA